MTEGDSNLGFKISLAVHIAVVVIGVFGGQLFRADPEPPIEIVDAAIVTAEEFAALSEAPPPAPEAEVEKPPQKEEIAFAETPPPEKEDIAEEPPALIEETVEPKKPEEQPVEEAKPEEKLLPAAEAPYEVAPDAPSELAFDERALDDKSPEDEIRKALPKPTTRTASELEKPADEDKAPEIALRDQPRPDPNRPNIAEAPAQPKVEAEDANPKPGAPDEEAPKKPQTAEKKPEEKKPEPKKPEPEVATAAPQEAQKPRGRPERPKQVAEAKPEPKKEEPKKEPEKPKAAQKPAEKKPTDLAAILGKAVERGAKQPVVARAAPRRAASRAGPPLSGLEKDGLRFAIERCWRKPPPGVANREELIVTIFVRLSPNGTVEAEPTLSRPATLTTQAQLNAFRSAQAAIMNCQPYRALPPAKYEQWRELNVTFDPWANGPSFD